MESDGKMIKSSKTLVQFDQSTAIISSSSVVEKESCSLDLTSSALMGARVTKCQANGSGVIGEESVHGNTSLDGGGGGSGSGGGGVGDGDGDDLSVANESLTGEDTRVGMIVGVEKGADGCEMDKGANDSQVGENMDGVVMDSHVGEKMDGVVMDSQVGEEMDGVVMDKGANDSQVGEEMDGTVMGNVPSDDPKEVCGKDLGVKFQDEKSSSEVSDSIAQRTRNRVVTGKNEDIGDVDVGQKGSEVDDEESVFRAGDFVWGKVKSHPWWPGRIYDPLNASEFALKYKHEGRLLVAYFGDRTFAWCDPSQLKSFEENFEEMSKQSSLKTFVTAVEEAENEFGSLVKLQTTCSCARENQSSLPFVVNAGVKEGVRVPENGTAKFSVAQFELSTMLADIRCMATFDSVANTLELTVIKSRLSAYYHAKFGYSLPVYCEPMGIEDPMIEQGVPRKTLFQGPDDGDWFIGSEDQTLRQNGLQTPPRDMSQRRRKSKSIAELLGIDTKDELENKMVGIEANSQLGKSAVKSGKRKRKVADEDKSFMPEVNGDDGFSKDEDHLGKQVSVSSRKKRKTVGESPNHATDNSMITRNTRSSSRKKKEDSVISTTSGKKASGDNDGKVKNKPKMAIVPQVSINGGSTAEEGYERISPREKKLSKYLSPPYTNLLQRQKSSCSQTRSEASGLVFSDVANVGERMSKTASKIVGSTPLVKCSKTASKIVGSTPLGKCGAETSQKSSSGLVFSDVANMGERMSKTASKLVGSSPLVKRRAETPQKFSKVSGSKHEEIDHHDQNSSKADLSSEANGPEKSIGSLNNVLREIHSAALDPLCTRRNRTFDSIKGFLTSYRSSNYRNGPNYKIYKKGLADDRRRKRKRSLSGTMHGSDSEQKVLNKVDQQTPKPKPSKRSATKREQKSNSKPDHEVSCEPPSSSATLVITFPAGFSMPTKEDIIRMCCKFGDVDESKTEVILELSTVKIVFVKISYAEAALDSLQKSAPFGTAQVSYKIQDPAALSSKSKKVNVQNKKKMKPSEVPVAKSTDKQPSVSPNSPSPLTEGEPLAVVFIKQKLEAMTSMLGQSDGKMSDEIKSNLENEVKELLKKVKKMTATSPSS